MKIAMIGTRGIPSRFGGVEKHTEEVAVRLVAMGNEVSVYCRAYYTSGKLSSFKGVRLIRLPTIRTKHLDNIVHTFLSTIDALRKKPDIIHYHGIGPSLLTFLPYLFGIKVVVTIHSMDWQLKKWGSFASFFLKAGEGMAVRFADRIIVVSKQLEEYIRGKYERKVSYIPNGVEKPVMIPPDLIKKYGLGKENFILCVGRLVPGKGIEYLLKAFKQVNTDKKLVITGDSGNTDSYLRYLKKISPKNVLFLGYQYDRMLQELYSNAYLYILPSEAEGLSISLLEALSYRRAVLVSDIPSNREVLNGFGFTFKNKNTADLLEKLRRLLIDKKAAFKNTYQARHYIHENYNWELVTNDIQSIYVKSLSHKRGCGLWDNGIQPPWYRYLYNFKLQCAHLIGSFFYYTGIIKVIISARRKILKRGRLFIIFYHRIAETTGRDFRLCTRPENFKEHLKYLAGRFNIVSLDEMLHYIEKQIYPEQDTVAITFDDGYRDNYTNAFPLLGKYNATAAIFVATGFIGKEMMLKDSQIKEMAEAGITFGAHSVTHPCFSLLSAQQAKTQILDSKLKLEVILKKPVEYFAYPYGCEHDFTSETVGLLKEADFKCAFTTVKEKNLMGSPKFFFPRKGIPDFSLPAFAAKMEGVFDFPFIFLNLMKKIKGKLSPARIIRTLSAILGVKRIKQGEDYLPYSRKV